MSLEILIVDDSAEKASELARGLEASPGDVKITVAADMTAAKRELQNRVFDLLVLDIALPLRAGEPLQKRGGLDLLAEIVARPNFKRPAHIVGLTAYQEIYESATDEFGAELWSVVFYDRASTDWLEQLQSKARHIRASAAAHDAEVGHDYDLCITTALGEPELAAILNLDWHWSQLPPTRDASIYYEGSYRQPGGRPGRVIAAKAPGMGMAAAAVLATKMILAFRPRCLVMAGICAGERSEVQLGDVIAANPSWDYGSGKHLIRDKADVFEPLPEPFKLSTRIRGLVERLKAERDVLLKVQQGFNGPKPNTLLDLHIGPLATGAAVLANSRLVTDIKRTQNRKLLGIDMEGYGVMAAADEAPAPRPEALVLKGVSDFADENKDDRFRHYSAFASAQVLALLAERHGL